MALMTSTQVASPNFIYCVNEYCCACQKITQISHIYLTSSIALVGNVDTLENTVNSIPIEILLFHDHGKVDRL